MKVYTLKNNQLSISVNSFGAEICSVKNLSNIEFIWQADKSIWARHAPVLFPIVGKLKNNQYTYNKKNYTLPQHGFARDKEFVLVEENENALEFELTSDEETLLIYPFHFSLRIRYELTGSAVKVKYIVFNPNNKILPFSIGAHPGFICALSENETLNDFYLEFKNKTELTAQKLKDGLMSDEIYIIKLDKGKLELNPELFLNDALVFKNNQIEKVILCSRKSNRRVELKCSDWPYFGIWTKKNSHGFTCLEPWCGVTDNWDANGNILEKAGIIALEPYHSFEKGYVLDFR